VTRPCSRPFARLALIGALVAAVGLAACGRKGPLDPPPGAAVAEPQQSVSPTPPTLMPPIGGSSSSSGGTETRNGLPVPARGEKKHIPIDVLIE